MTHRNLALLIASLLAAPLLAGEVKTLSGAAVQGALVRLAADGVVLKGEDGKEKSFPLAEVLSVELNPPPKDGVVPPASWQLVRLIDGSRFAAEEIRFVDDRLLARLPGGRTVSAPLAAVVSLLFDAQDPKNEEEFQAALGKAPQTDVVRLTSRDGKSVNVFEGVVGAADAQGATLKFTPEGGQPVQLAVARLRGIAFARPGPALAAPLGKLIDLRDNQFALASLEVGDKELKATTPAGLAFTLPLAEALRIDLSAGKLAYLSDLEPLRVESEHHTYVPPTGQRFGRDKTLKGGPLSVGKKRYAKGLSAHAKTVLEYDVAGYNAFRCVLGLDDSVSRVGAALVRIEGDGKELFSQPVTLRDAKPHEVELKIAGVKRLRLIVDFGDDLDLGDHVDFADARVMK